MGPANLLYDLCPGSNTTVGWAIEDEGRMTESALRWTFSGVSPSGEGGSGAGVYIILENEGSGGFLLGASTGPLGPFSGPTWLGPTWVLVGLPLGPIPGESPGRSPGRIPRGDPVGEPPGGPLGNPLGGSPRLISPGGSLGGIPPGDPSGGPDYTYPVTTRLLATGQKR